MTPDAISHLVEAAMLALLVWIARTTQSNNVQLATIAQSHQDMKDRNEHQDTKLEDVRTRLAAVEIEIAKINTARSS
jgi:hypothetical protein